MVLDLLDAQSPIRAGYEPVMRGAGAKVLELGGLA
jgi:hypothetical protein